MRHLLAYELFEATQEAKKLPPVKLNLIDPPKLTPLVQTTNREIAKALADKNVKIPASTESKDYLQKVSSTF